MIGLANGGGHEPAVPSIRLSLIVLVASGERDDLDRCLTSVEAHPAVGHQQLIVVDNGSRDGSAEMLASEHPAAEVVVNSHNLGVARGRNAGLRLAGGRFVAMLDSDVVVHPNALETLCRYLEDNPSVGLVGPRIEYPDGTLQLSARRVPSPAALVANRLDFQWARDLKTRRRHLMIGEDHNRAREVEYLLGATMVFRREVAATVGGFDARMTLGGYGFDDADWALCARENGWRVVYLPTATVTHTYRRRLAGKPLSVGNLGMALSYCLFRGKHARAGRGRAMVRLAGEPCARLAMFCGRFSRNRRGVALMYHRLAARTGDPERELVPAHGAALVEFQLRHVAGAYRVVPASELLEAVKRRRRGERFPLAITFDDDLASHGAFALPILRKTGLTATFFICGASLEGPRDFWWDRLQAAVDARRFVALESVAPGALALEGRPSRIHELAGRIEALPANDRAELDRRLAALAPAGDPPGGGLRSRDLEALVEAGMEVGFHTREHDALPTLSDAELANAMHLGRDAVEEIVGGPLTAFSYPHGKAGVREAGAVRAAGYGVAFTSAPSTVSPDDDPFRLGRIEPSFASTGDFALRLAAEFLMPRRVRRHG